MKKILAIVLAVIFCTSVAVFAQPVFEDMNVTVVLNGTVLEFDQKPLVENGRTLVPVRKIFESLGAVVNYDEETESVISFKDNLIILMQVNHDVMYVNDTPVKLDVPAREVGGRTLVPVRAIADAMQVEVGWDGDTQTVTLTSK